MAGTHQAYTKKDGSWQEVTADEIRKYTALLVYFGLVKISDSVDSHWSTKSLYNSLWARSFMTHFRFRALMAMLHVDDPANEPEGDKLRKVNSLLEFFKERSKELYQPKRNVAVDERMVKSRNRPGIRQFNKDKPTRWGIKLWVLAHSSNGYPLTSMSTLVKLQGRRSVRTGSDMMS